MVQHDHRICAATLFYIHSSFFLKYIAMALFGLVCRGRSNSSFLVYSPSVVLRC